MYSAGGKDPVANLDLGDIAKIVITHVVGLGYGRAIAIGVALDLA